MSTFFRIFFPYSSDPFEKPQILQGKLRGAIYLFIYNILFIYCVLQSFFGNECFSITLLSFFIPLNDNNLDQAPSASCPAQSFARTGSS